MTPEIEVLVLSAFLVFCRIGSCLMVLPGFSSMRIPAQIRLFVAVAIAFAVAPRLLPDIMPLVRGASDDMRIAMMFSELLNGLLIGLLGRVFMIALQFSGSVIANAIGMGQTLGVPIEGHEADPALVSLITLTATVLIFSLNLHAEIVQALLASYRAMPVELGFSIRSGSPRSSTISTRPSTSACGSRAPSSSMRDRQLRGGSCQQDDAADPDLLHLAALRSGGRPHSPRLLDRRLPDAVHRGLPQLGAERMSGQSRAARLARVRDVQEKMRQLEEWRLGELVREETRLLETERELLETLGSQSLMQGLFLEGKAAALRRNDVVLRETQAKEALAREKVRQAQATEKRIERAAGKAEASERAATERSELLLALEDHLAARAASFE